MLVLLEAQEENWDEIDLMVRAFQQTTMALRYADVPVVVAPAGLALGGGCEIALHADRVQAAAKPTSGWSKVGVGLIPAGGGTKEMVARAAERAGPEHDFLPVDPARIRDDRLRARRRPAAPMRCGSATCGRSIGHDEPRAADRDAKARALQRVREGYQPPPRARPFRSAARRVRRR